MHGALKSTRWCSDYVHPSHLEIGNLKKTQILGNAGDSNIEPKVAAFIHFLYTDWKIDPHFSLL